ncbi:MAG: GntR family transcriptional regulator, partial [Actinomycetales bacterium]
MPTKAREVLLGPIEARGATEQIVRRLGEAIGSGVLAPGERLPPEADLARMLDVAPMTLRQAPRVRRVDR